MSHLIPIFLIVFLATTCHVFSELSELSKNNPEQDCLPQYQFDGKKLTLSNAEWEKRLTPEQFKILRENGTEPAFHNAYDTNKEAGIYQCAACELPLYSSNTKYDSGTGWPSFWQPICPKNIILEEDNSWFMKRTGVSCARCGGHLGHVFDDGPQPTGKRYCMNSTAMKFIEK